MIRGGGRVVEVERERGGASNARITQPNKFNTILSVYMVFERSFLYSLENKKKHLKILIN